MAELGISSVTEAELRFGVVRKAGATRLQIAVEEFLVRMEIVPWDSSAAQQYATMRA
jgi:tRNA(fMet)-specific endonuclease VapC